MENSCTAHVNQYNQLTKKLLQVTDEMVNHGFAKASIEVKTVKQKKREVIISAGKEYKYTIPVEELP